MIPTSNKASSTDSSTPSPTASTTEFVRFGHAYDSIFVHRLVKHWPQLHHLLQKLYGHRPDFEPFCTHLIQTLWQSYQQRSEQLCLEDEQSHANPIAQFTHSDNVAAMAYVDLFGGDLKRFKARIPYLQELGVRYLHLMPLFKTPEGQSDGGYAVSSYREVNPALGNMADLQALIAALREHGIHVMLDFIFNHTANDHAWAKGCIAGDPAFADFYLIYPDRTLPDQYDRTVREIFPDQHAGAFSQLPDGRWIWTTFNTFQWDLNYANPAVFEAMAGEMLSIANLGVSVLRMDAVAFVWKRLGTTCENLPEAHTLIQAFNAVAQIVAPSLTFLSEAIVHPDLVRQYIDPKECQLSYNPLQMALLWESLATTKIELLNQALTRRHNLPAGTAWVNYVRCHDDIGWTFADEEAAELGINGFDHRKFLNQFYVGRLPYSFAQGVPFQDNPQTGDCRICGMGASLVGINHPDPFEQSMALDRLALLYSVAISSGGVPLLYLGDELAQPNDDSYLLDPIKAPDSRWVHRPALDEARLKDRHNLKTTAGQAFTRLRRLITIRQQTPELAGTHLCTFNTHNPHVLGYFRHPNDATDATQSRILVLANFSPAAQRLESHLFSALPSFTPDLLRQHDVNLRTHLTMLPYEVLWLRVGPAS